MTILRPLIVIMAALMLFSPAAAQDLNSYSEAELNAYIAQLIAQQQSSIQQQPVVVQIKSDEALNQKIDLIVSQLGELKASSDRLQEKFGVMSTEFDAKLQAAEERIASRQEAKVDEATSGQTAVLQDYVREQTNPVRMNLPAIGVFLMATALFLIFISRTYNFKGKEIHLEPKKEAIGEKESREEFDKVLKEAKEEKEKEEKRIALAELVKAQKAISQEIKEMSRNG